MIYILGKRFFGRTDNVPGVCYVVTLFAHGFWFPLLPIRSYLIPISPGQPDVIDGIPIPPSVKSVVLGYVRAVCVVAVAMFGLAAYDTREQINPYTGGPLWPPHALKAAVAFAVLALSYAMAWRATSTRMAQLASTPGLAYSLSSKLRELADRKRAVSAN